MDQKSAGVISALDFLSVLLNVNSGFSRNSILQTQISIKGELHLLYFLTA